ncbi:MAG: single-stranded-DNA-specific exonuclease RecJ [Nitrospinaceae bacterium]
MLSLLNKTWSIATPAPNRVQELVQELGVPPVIGELLVNRNIRTAEEGRSLVNRDLTKLHDPFLMAGMREAVDRIVRAINTEESITVFTDYDVDGVSSAAFLTHFFRDLGVNVNYYLPDRMKEGYGLNTDAVRKIRRKGSTLLITADCGITCVREIEIANEIGLDVIVSDHHQVGKNGLPAAVAVLNPHQPLCQYPYRFLSGVGIVFKLATALRGELYRSGWDKARLPNLKRHLDLFVLGTIADVAPLTGENHILSSHGLDVISASSKPGVVALKEVARVDGKVTSRSVGFALGPRLNAAGRMGKADAGLHLLTATDLNEAKALARTIDQINLDRREVQAGTLEEAEYLIGREMDLDRVIVLASENFHQGVIGIVASRLADKYYRPTVLISLDENGHGKGSGRSIPKFNLFKALSECSGFFTQFGGHAYAAGLSMEKKNIPAFKEAVNEIGRRILCEDDLIPELKIDSVLDLSEINRELFKNIQALEPFGAENPVPVFLSSRVHIQNLRTMGKDKNHVRFKAIQEGGYIDVVGFNLGDTFASLDLEEGPVDIAYEIQVNDWNGQDKVELRLLDVRKTMPEES